MVHSNIPSRVHSPWAQAESALRHRRRRTLGWQGFRCPVALTAPCLDGEMMEIVHRVALGCRVVGSALSESARKVQTNWQGRSAGPAGPAGGELGRRGRAASRALNPTQPHSLAGADRVGNWTWSWDLHRLQTIAPRLENSQSGKPFSNSASKVSKWACHLSSSRTSHLAESQASNNFGPCRLGHCRMAHSPSATCTAHRTESEQPCPNRQHPPPSTSTPSTPNELSTPREAFRMASSFEFTLIKHIQPHSPQRPPRRRRLPFCSLRPTRVAVKRSRLVLDKDRIAKTRCRSVQDSSSPHNPLH
jgi:hypothetical protein